MDYTIANWNKFKCILEQLDNKEILKSEDPEHINKYIITNINKAVKESIPFKNKNKKFHTRVPECMRKLISHKKYLLKNKINGNLNSEISKISKIIKEEINVLRNKNWDNFTSNVNENPLSSKKFWSRIDKIKNDGIDKQRWVIGLNDYFNRLKFDYD